MSLKQRLIGASVLIALAVIFVPMFLDGSGYKEQVAMDLTIPPEPEFKFEEPLPAMPEIITEQQLKPAETKPLTQGSIEESVDITSRESTTKNNTLAREWLQNPRTQSASSTPPQPKAKPQPTPTALPPADTPAWVVQVGSFKKKENALALQEKLSDTGYKVFLEKGGSRQTPIYRVKVGPESKRVHAEVIQKRLLAKLKLKGIVIK